MVNIRVERQDERIREVTIRDHAKFAQRGEDLVCAGVSSIVFGMMNALEQFAEGVCSYEIKDAYVTICLKQRNDAADLLLETMLLQLKTLEESYHNYITIHDQEV